jgi:hypothetical protein
LPILHNAVLIALSLYMGVEILRHAVGSGYGFVCNRVDRTSESGLGMAKVLYIFYLSKAYEFVDTFIMALKKKTDQISFLHLYHHFMTFLLWWFGMRFTPGGDAYFSAMLNSFVHVVMYAYYLCAALGVRFPFKKLVTQLQLVQFAVNLVHSGLGCTTAATTSPTTFRRAGCHRRPACLHDVVPGSLWSCSTTRHTSRGSRKAEETTVNREHLGFHFWIDVAYLVVRVRIGVLVRSRSLHPPSWRRRLASRSFSPQQRWSSWSSVLPFSRQGSVVVVVVVVAAVDGSRRLLGQQRICCCRQRPRRRPERREWSAVAAASGVVGSAAVAAGGGDCPLRARVVRCWARASRCGWRCCSDLLPRRRRCWCCCCRRNSRISEPSSAELVSWPAPATAPGAPSGSVRVTVSNMTTPRLWSS